jgi:2-keto-4-pentenoate hydratase/2-oxohepta-3-ene-1,7-dioic acid hydratase in catechol pathway
MAVNVIRYQKKDQSEICWGVVGKRINPIVGEYRDTADFIQNGKQAAFALAQKLENHEASDGIDPAEVDILSPVTGPCQVLCQGANYRQHMIESGMDPDAKTFNMMFNKSAACITRANADVVRPAHVKLLDYEIELGLIIGDAITEAVELDDQDLPNHIAGLVIGNDYSARDVQVPQMQFFKGKSYRTFCPLGPYLCLLQPDDFAYLSRLRLTLTVNGEIRQQDNTENLVFKPAETLSELSQIANLNTGDVVLTGTPAGCAMQLPSPFLVRLLGLVPERKKWKIFIRAQSRKPNYLQPDDVVEATIRSDDGHIDLGMQRNRIVSA